MFWPFIVLWLLLSKCRPIHWHFYLLNFKVQTRRVCGIARI